MLKQLATMGAVAGSAIAMAAAPAAAYPGNLYDPAEAPATANAVFHTYTITRASATYQPVRYKYNILPGGGDDVVIDVSTGFPIRMYGQSFFTAHVSSNGNIQFGSSPSSAYVNEALPSTTLSGVAVAPYWDDLIIRPNSPTVLDGIFAQTKGSAPHRTFTVSWRGLDYATQSTAVRFETIFTEGSSNVVTIYGDGNGSSATIGVQRSGAGQATQYAFNTGHNTSILPGEKLTYIYH